MRRRENRGAAVFGCVLFLVFCSVCLLVTTDAGAAGGDEQAGSPSSTASRGLSILRRALALSGVAVDRLSDGLLDEKQQTVLVVEPRVPLDADLAHDLERMVWRGDVTLVAAGGREDLLNLPVGVLPGLVPEITHRSESIRVTQRLPFQVYRAGVLVGSRDPEDEAARSLRCFDGTPEDAEVLAESATSGLPVVLVVRSGAGLVVLVSEPRIFENAWLHQYDNVELVGSLLATQPRVTIDERQFAEQVGSELTMSLIYGTAPGRAVVLGVLAGLLLAWLTGLQPGGPPLRAVRRRHPTEFVDSLAALSLAAGPRRLLVRHFQARFQRRACRVLRLAPDTEFATLAQAVSERTDTPVETVARVLRGSPPAADVADWIARMDSWERLL